jgi:hypothetical protein
VGPLVGRSHALANSACTVQARGSAWSSVCGPHRAQRSGACRTRGTALRDGVTLHSTRQPVWARAALAHGSLACVCSILHTRPYRLPCEPPWRAPSPRERIRRKSNAGTCGHPTLIAPQVAYGKPLDLRCGARHKIGFSQGLPAKHQTLIGRPRTGSEESAGPIGPLEPLWHVHL